MLHRKIKTSRLPRSILLVLSEHRLNGTDNSEWASHDLEKARKILEGFQRTNYPAEKYIKMLKGEIGQLFSGTGGVVLSGAKLWGRVEGVAKMVVEKGSLSYEEVKH